MIYFFTSHFVNVLLSAHADSLHKYDLFYFIFGENCDLVDF